jgi:hypothetical protein
VWQYIFINPNRTIMKLKQLLPAIFILIITIVSGCKKENLSSGKGTNELGLISQTAKAWFESQGTNIKNSGLQILGNGEPDWNSTAYYPNENIYITHIKLKDQSIANKYLVEKADKSGKITNANYYIVLTKNKTANPEKIIEIYLFGKDQMPENFSGALLEYDLNNNVVFNSHYKNGKQENKTDKLVHKSNGSKENKESGYVDPNECQGEWICIEWYWQIWVNGELVYEEYLYTTCGCSGVGGGGGGGGGQNCNPALVSPEEIEYNNYVLMQPGSQITSTTVTTTAGTNPINGVTIWAVTGGQIANWQIKATTNYSYYHHRYFDMNLNAFVHTYDLFNYHTVSSYYTGSNTFITSTWTQTSVLDQVFNNNTANTYGTSVVHGTIRHKTNIPLSLPYCGPLSLDQTFEIAPNTLIFYPR